MITLFRDTNPPTPDRWVDAETPRWIDSEGNHYRLAYQNRRGDFYRDLRLTDYIYPHHDLTQSFESIEAIPYARYEHCYQRRSGGDYRSACYIWTVPTGTVVEQQYAGVVQRFVVTAPRAVVSASAGDRCRAVEGCYEIAQRSVGAPASPK